MYINNSRTDRIRTLRHALTLLIGLALLSGACACAEAAGFPEMPALTEAPLQAEPQAQVRPGLEVYFFELGRVDGILIRCDGETSFIDVGFKRDAAKSIKYLQALGVTHLDSYIGTHAHADHVEGGPEMITAFQASRIYIGHENTLKAINSCCDATQKAAVNAAEVVTLKPGDTFNIGRAVMTCLGPLRHRNVNPASAPENENSLILRMDYGQRSFLFTGDTTAGVLSAVHERYPELLHVDVLKNPHHNGTVYRRTMEMITPKYVVFCTTDSDPIKSSYKQLMVSMGIRGLLTGSKNQGSICMISDGESLEVRCGYNVQSVMLDRMPPMYVGQTASIRCVTFPEDDSARKHLGWNSSDESIVIAHNGELLAMAPGAATVTAVSLNGVRDSAEVQVYDACIVLEEDRLELSTGESHQLKGSIMPKDAKGVTGEWISTDPLVATVSSEGKVKAVSKGKAQIVGRLSNGAETVCDVTVKGLPAKSIKLNQKNVTLHVGDTMTLTCKIRPSDYDPEDLEWTSSDESVLWVDANGNVTAVGTGRARIEVTASKGVHASCTFHVHTE